METANIIIDGRQFHGVSQELSAAQDDYIIGQLRLAGALELLLTAQTTPSEEIAEALLTQILLSVRAAQVLAGCLTEQGKEWSFQDASSNAMRFARTTSADDKRAMRAAIVGFVVGFFQYATASAATSQKSSSLN